MRLSNRLTRLERQTGTDRQESGEEWAERMQREDFERQCAEFMRLLAELPEEYKAGIAANLNSRTEAVPAGLIYDRPPDPFNGWRIAFEGLWNQAQYNLAGWDTGEWDEPVGIVERAVKGAERDKAKAFCDTLPTKAERQAYALAWRAEHPNFFWWPET